MAFELAHFPEFPKPWINILLNALFLDGVRNFLFYHQPLWDHNIFGLSIFQGKKLGTTKKDVTKDVSFYLWTRDNPVDKTTLKLDETILPSLAHSQFNPNNPIKILVHGYTGFGDMGWIQQTRDEFLKKGKPVFIDSAE